MKFWNKKEKNENMRKPVKREWMIVIACVLILSCCYLYTDLPFSTAAGLRVWNCIEDGELSLFYWSNYPGVEGSALPDGSSGGAYDFLIYVIFAIYSFPLWIWEKITGLSFIQSVPARVYMKGILWLFSGISAYLLYKIAVYCEVKKENAIWAPILFLSSGIFFAAEVTIGGYDIISVAFSLMGIYAYLKKNDKWFLVSFAVAIATKLFAFWLFIPLLLLREKKIWKLMVKVLLSISSIAIPKAYFAFASKSQIIQELESSAAETVYGISNAQDAPMVINDVIAHSKIIDEALFPTDYTANYTFLSLENMPLVFLGMFVVWIWCYVNKRELEKREIIYLCALVMGIFITTVKVHPYWGILLVPYLILLLLFNPKHIKENLLLETIISVGYVFNKAILYYWCFGMAQIERMVGPNYRFSYDPEEINIGKYGLESIIAKLSEKVGISETNIAHTFSALYVAGIVYFLYYNWPKRVSDEGEFLGDIQGYHKALIMRFAFAIFVGIMPMIGLILYLTPYNWSV